MALHESGVRLRAEGEAALNKAMKALDQSLKNLDNATKKASGGFKELNDSIKRAEKIENLTDKIKLQRTSLDQLKEKLEKVSSAYQESGQKVAKAREAIEKMEESIRQSATAMENSKKELEELKAKLVAATAQYGEGSQEVNELKESIEQSNKALNQAEKEFEEQNKALAGLKTNLEQSSREYESNGEKAQRAQAAIGKLTIGIRQNEQALSGLNREEEESKRKTQENIAAKARAAEAAGKAATAVGDLRAKLDQEAAAADRAANATRDAAKATDSIDDVANKASAGLARLGSSLRESGEGFNAFREIAIGALRRVGEMIVNISAEIARRMFDIAKSTIQISGDYEATLNRFAAVAGDAMGDAGMSLREFDKLALQMGAETQFSAQQAAQAMVELAKGGIDPAAISAGTLKAALTLAAAGELDLAKSAEILAKQLGVWSANGVKAAEVADLMSQAANASTVDVDELALGMANVGGAAMGVGASFKETVQTMALLAPGFSSASDAGTSLKVLLSRLQPMTTAQALAMDRLNLTNAEGKSLFFDVEGGFLGLEHAAGLLQDRLGDLSDEKLSEALVDLFGQDAQRAGLGLVKAGAEGFNAMGIAMQKAGSAAEQAEKRNQGLNFAIESLLGSLETLQILVGKFVNPAITALIQGALIPATNSFVSFFSALVDGYKYFETIEEGAEAVSGAVRKMGGDALTVFDAPSEGAKNLENTLSSLSGAFKGIIPERALKRFDVLVRVIYNLARKVMPDLQSGAGNIKDALYDIIDNALVSFFDTLIRLADSVSRNWESIVQTANSVAAGVSTMGNAFRFIGGVIRGAIGNFAQFGQVMQGAFSGGNAGKAFGQIASAVQPVIGAFRAFVTSSEAMKGALTGVMVLLGGAGIAAGVMAVAGALVSLVNPITLTIAAFAMFGAAWQTNFGGLRDVVMSHIPMVITAFNMLWETISTIASYLVGVFTPVYQAIQLFGQGAIAEIVNFVQTGKSNFDNLNVILMQVALAVYKVFFDIAAAVVNNLPAFVAGTLQYGYALVSWISTAAITLNANLATLLTNLAAYVVSRLPDWIASLLVWGTELVAWIGRAIPFLIVELTNFLMSLTRWSESEARPRMESMASEWGRALIEWVQKELIPKVKPAFEEFMKAIKIALSNIGSTLWRLGGELAGKLIDGLVNSLRAGASEVYSAINSLFSGAVGEAEAVTETHSPSEVFARIGRGLVSGLVNGLTGGQAIGAVTTMMTTIITTAQALIPQWVTLMARFGQESWMWAQRALPLLQSQLVSWENTLITGLSMRLPLFAAQLALWGIQAWQWLQVALIPLQAQMVIFSTALNLWAMTVVLPNLIAQASQWAISLYMWIPNELIPGIQPMWQWFLNDSIANMKRIEDEMYKAGKRIGSAIIKGILQGIKDNKHKITQLLVDVIAEAIAAAKQELGIASPSRVFYTIGEQVMAGMAAGISSGAKATVGEMNSVIDKIIGSSDGVNPLVNMSIPDLAKSKLIPEMASSKIVAAAGQGGAVAPPASGQQIANNRSVSHSYSTQKNYNLTVNTPRHSQGVMSDFRVMQVMDGV